MSARPVAAALLSRCSGQAFPPDGLLLHPGHRPAALGPLQRAPPGRARGDEPVEQQRERRDQHRAGWVAVLDGSRFLGGLTPESLHAALRRSVEDMEPETAGAV